MRGQVTTGIRVCAGAAVVVSIVTLLAACGDGDEPTTDTSSITVIAADFAFSPDLWTVAADESVDVTLTNQGTVEHEWAVLKEGERISNEADFTEDLVEFEIEAIDPGASTTQSFTLPAGTYQVVCAIESHFDQGMEGELRVRN